MKNSLYQTVPGGFAIAASNFLVASLNDMIPWLFVSFFVVLCDCAFGIRKSFLMNEAVRFSSAIRRTMGKMVTYFAFVCMVVMINIASGKDWQIDVYACLLVCFIEFCSIISNILKPKGINLDLIAVISLMCYKLFRIDKSEVREVLHEDNTNQNSK